MKKVILTSLLLAISLTLTVNGLAQNLNDFSIHVIVNSDINNQKTINVALIFPLPNNAGDEPLNEIPDSIGHITSPTINPSITDNLSKIIIDIKLEDQSILNKTILLANNDNVKIGFNSIVVSEVGVLDPNKYSADIYIKDNQNVSSQIKSIEFIVYK